MRYEVDVMVWDIIEVQVEGDERASYEEIVALVEEKLLRDGYPEVFLDIDRKNVQIRPLPDGGRPAKGGG